MGEPQRDRFAAATLKIRYKCASIDEFIRQYSNDISLFGIFIEMKSPLKEGVALQLEFLLEDGSPFIRGLGQVVWRREIAESDDRPAGVGVKFLKLSQDSREIIERAVDARGLAPSRFDRLGEAAARATYESERPLRKPASIPVGRTAGVFSSDKPLSLSPDSNAPAASSTVDTRPPKSSFTRVKTISVPNREDDRGVWSAEELEKLDRAFSEPASAPEETAQSTDERITAFTDPPTDPIEDFRVWSRPELEKLDQAFSTPASAPEETGQPTDERITALADAPTNQINDPGAWSREELEKLDQAFSTPASAPDVAASSEPPEPAPIEPAAKAPAETGTPAEPTEEFDPTSTSRSGIKGVRRAVPVNRADDYSELKGRVVSPLPPAIESPSQSIEPESDDTEPTSAYPSEQSYADGTRSYTARPKLATLRARLAKQAPPRLPRPRYRMPSLAPPGPTSTQGIPQGDAKPVQTLSSTGGETVAPGDSHKPQPLSGRSKLTKLAERLAKQDTSEISPALSDHEFAQRVGRLADFALEMGTSKNMPRGLRLVMAVILSILRWVFRVVWKLAELTVVIAIPALRYALQFIRKIVIQRRREVAISALLVLLFAGIAAAYWLMAPKAVRVARVLGKETNQALISAGAELHRSAEELGLIGALNEPSDSDQAAKNRPKRYLIKVITQPAGATVAVEKKRFITPGAAELTKPEGALRVEVRKRNYHSIQRRITSMDFQREGDFFTYNLDLRLEKLPSNTPIKPVASRTKPCKPCDTPAKSDGATPTSNAPTPAKNPPAPKSNAPTPKKKAPTFYLEPMPEFPKK